MNLQLPSDDPIFWFMFVLTMLITFLIMISITRAEEIRPEIWKVLLAEGVSEGFDGMYAIACVIRNRGGDLSGFVGAKRKDLEQLCNRQPKKVIQMAKRIEAMVFKDGAEDITDGATHFENMEKFGKPYWTKGMIKTIKLKSHTFFKIKKKEKLAGVPSKKEEGLKRP